MKSLTSLSAEDTHSFGRAVGGAVTKGVTMALTGDLGAGKTTFIQGLARGMGVPEDYPVTSPTFSLINTKEHNQIFRAK